ncbi:uncharacterized protein HD556DRAFT_1447573 [Suillus plorans]|uniref:Uncharacterized protein n=1 Tax=Suillus plorans TaxID=116603 RepID=A0A9P7AG73_9AGAM|nr:uncharacterized protein HD556DRAFT_1447573 [Suillus plorans]KAG1788721.1 hypothetical protein HD556DRAFT_1447573 [Suillus plorans]
MPARRHRSLSTSSSSSSDSDDSMMSQSRSTSPPTTSPMHKEPKRKKSLQKRARESSDSNTDAKKPKKRTKKHKDSDSGNKPKQKGMSLQEQCLHIAHWIPRGVDMFCKLTDVFWVAPLVEQREAAEKADHIEDEQVKSDREAILKNISKDEEARMMRTYKKITTAAPYLLTLVNGNKKKRRELEGLLTEMQMIIGQVRSEDASHLKPVIGQYAAYDPDDKDLDPPIRANNQRSHAKMGINHPQLARMLCPVKHLGEYLKDPIATRQKLENGDIKMRALVWPAMVYSGKIAGEHFNPQLVQNGLFEGYLLEQVMRHLFTGPSSALCTDSESVGTRPCNARLHNMMEVEAENIAYGVIQSRFTIGSRDKWKEEDGTYNYRDAYYRIISTIRDAPDPSWAKALHEHWNLKLFKNKLGLRASSSTNTTDDDDDDDFALMRKQYEQRLADEATAQMVSSDSGPGGEELPTPPKSPSVPVTASDGAKSSTSLPPEIPPPSPDPKPQESATSEKPEEQVVSAKEPAVNDFSDLSEPDKLDKEPQPPKSKAKRGRICKAVVQSPLPAPKKARTSCKKK